MAHDFERSGESPPEVSGALWLARFSRIVESCAARWQLTMQEELSGGLVGHVYSCTDARGRPLVLKLSPPSSARNAAAPQAEAAALSAWAGHGAVALRDFDPSSGALLLERVLPGSPLPPGEDEAVLPHVAAVLEALHSAPLPSQFSFDSLADGISRHLKWKRAHAAPNAVEAAALIDGALGTASRLCARVDRGVLLHGDLMDKNLLRGPSSFVAIDPMPMVGDAHADIGFWTATRQPANAIESRAQALAALLGYDSVRTVQWATVWAVGAACENWRSDTHELREWLQTDLARQVLAT